MATDRAQPRLSEWTPVQKGVLVISALQILWSIAGFIAEPTFAVGEDAPTATVLWVDFNGWHALSGLLLFVPGLIAAFRAEWAVVYAWAAAGALVVTGLWALAETQVAYVFTFPNNEADAVLHLATGALFVALGVVGGARPRPFRRPTAT
jgi:hypothetical protein